MHVEKNYMPFDSTLTVRTADGHHVRFLLDPLDAHYLVPPHDFAIAGMLPPQDFQVRDALADMKASAERAAAVGFFARILDSTKCQARRQMALAMEQRLRELVRSSPEHMAALRRIVNAMPFDNGGREALASYLQ